MKIYDYKGKKNLCGKRAREARLRQRLLQYALTVKLQTEGILMEQDSISRTETGTRFVVDYEIKVIAKTLNAPVWWPLEGEQKEKYLSKKELTFRFIYYILRS